MRGHWRGREWRHGHEHGPGRLRHYFGAHLHRRLFWWFGASIFVTVVVTSLLSHALSGHGSTRGVMLLGVAGLMLWMMSGKLARRIARPLYQLVKVTEEIGAGKLQARAQLPPWGIGEISVLGAAINDMAARIERQIGDQRELLAGVSHEIRTPLARIRVLLELARTGGIGADANTSGKTLDELEREVMEIDSLVGELLASARLDFAALSVHALDAADVARRALERAGLAPALLSVETTDVRFAGDPTLLARALANLLDNARKHGGGAKRVRVRREGTAVVFEVEDDGPGFPGGDAAAMGTRQRPEGSLGLGLVLVRRIADAHAGALVLANRDPRGARAALSVAANPTTKPT